MDTNIHNIINENERKHWRYLGRKKIFFDCLNNFIKPKNDLIVLDIGCGEGEIMDVLSSYGKVYGLDSSPEAINNCQNKGYHQLLLGSAESLPFADCFFDLVLASDIIEHLRDDEAFIKELFRVTKPGGIVLLSTAAYSFLWSDFDKQAAHFRRYVKKELSQKISKYFIIKKASYYNFFLFLPILLFRLIQKVKKTKAGFELKTPKAPINFLMKQVLFLESWLLKIINLPFGVSLFFIFKKNWFYKN